MSYAEPPPPRSRLGASAAKFAWKAPNAGLAPSWITAAFQSDGHGLALCACRTSAKSNTPLCSHVVMEQHGMRKALILRYHAGRRSITTAMPRGSASVECLPVIRVFSPLRVAILTAASLTLWGPGLTPFSGLSFRRTKAPPNTTLSAQKSVAHDLGRREEPRGWGLACTCLSCTQDDPQPHETPPSVALEESRAPVHHLEVRWEASR